MYQRNYADYYIKEDPDSPFSKFLVKFFSRKPDLEKWGAKSASLMKSSTPYRCRTSASGWRQKQRNGRQLKNDTSNQFFQ